MKKFTSITILLLSLSVFLLINTTNLAFATPENWSEIIRFTGSGTDIRTTDYFTCYHGEWRIRWEYVPDSQYSNLSSLSVFTYPIMEGDRGPMYINVIMKTGPEDTNGTSSIHDYPGTFHLNIDVRWIESYTLIVEQELESIPESPSEGTIYIRVDGSVEGTDKIPRDGDVYTLIADIIGSIVVERDNVVLDGAGYRLQGERNENGITLRISNNITVKNLKLSSFNIGIVVMGSDNNTIVENTITYSFRGLDFTGSENNIVSGNYIANNTYGIALENMYNNISENIVTNNSDIGIFLYGAGSNNIIGNNITKNKRGIAVSICCDNVIHHNNFVNNTNHVETDDSKSIWDNGEEGNYWDNYNGIDDDCDGIGDIPNIITENNQDNFPIMNQFQNQGYMPTERIELFPTITLLGIISLLAIAGVVLLVFFIKTKKKRSGVK